MTKDKKLEIRMSEGEMIMLRCGAEKAGKSLSEWARSLLFQESKDYAAKLKSGFWDDVEAAQSTPGNPVHDGAGPLPDTTDDRDDPVYCLDFLTKLSNKSLEEFESAGELLTKFGISPPKNIRDPKKLAIWLSKYHK